MICELLGFAVGFVHSLLNHAFVVQVLEQNLSRVRLILAGSMFGDECSGSRMGVVLTFTEPCTVQPVNL